MLSKLKSGKCWTRLASYPLQYGSWPWWNNPAICKASSEENGTGQYPEPHGKRTLGPELKSTKIPWNQFSFLDAFYGFKEVCFFHCAHPHSFLSKKYRLTWDGKCEKFRVFFSLTQAQSGGTPDFKWRGWSNGSKNQNPQKIARPKFILQKIPCRISEQ